MGIAHPRLYAPTVKQLNVANMLINAGWRYQEGFGPHVEREMDFLLYLECGESDDDIQGGVDPDGLVVGLGGSREDLSVEDAISMAAKWIKDPKKEPVVSQGLSKLEKVRYIVSSMCGGHDIGDVFHAYVAVKGDDDRSILFLPENIESGRVNPCFVVCEIMTEERVNSLEDDEFNDLTDGSGDLYVEVNERAYINMPAKVRAIT